MKIAVAALLLGLASALGVGGAGASPLAPLSDVGHGIGLIKACTSPTKVGDQYNCTVSIRNVLDDAEDTQTISNLTDIVHAAGGEVVSTTVLDDAPVVPSRGATCTAPPNRVCTLPFGGRVDVGPFSFYTVHGSDFTGANPLTDDAILTRRDLCDDPAGTGNANCNPNPRNVGAASQSTLVRRASQTASTIHSAAHGAVTVVERGATVHDFVSVTGVAGQPAPSGNVTIDWFTNNTCTGAPAATSAPIALGGGGTVDATGFPQGPLGPGLFGFLAHYADDATYTESNGPCEPLRVVDANIQLAPATAANAVGTNHTLTCHINVNDGTGQANAPDGTVCTVAIISGPGTPATQNCTASGGTGTGTGSCDATVTSSTPGTSTIRSSMNVAVGELLLHRETGDAHPDDGLNATKNWADDTVGTDVRDAANNSATNTTVPSGTVVHGEATVARAAGTPAGVPDPTGTVTFTLFNGTGCNGAAVASDPNERLNAAGLAASATFTTPSQGGVFSYLAHYNGDANYPAHDAACEPFQVNAVQGHGRGAGSGSIFGTVDGVPSTRITHRFELPCDAGDSRRSLEVNWAGPNNFHLEKLINSAVCFDDPSTKPPPPPGAVFDTYAGNRLFNDHSGYHGFGYAVGTGICNNLPATIYFILTDAGEPGTGDIAEYHIVGGCTLDIGPTFLTKGNHQFHKS